MDIPCRASKNGLMFLVRVKPRASRRAVEGVKNGVLQIRLTAPPADGEANAQLIEILSKEFGIRKSAFTIIKGLSSRNKTIELTGGVTDPFYIDNSIPSP